VARLLTAGLVCAVVVLGATVDDAFGLRALAGSHANAAEVHVAEALGRESNADAAETAEEHVLGVVLGSTGRSPRPVVVVPPTEVRWADAGPEHLPPDRAPPGT
jgi:hypothetical protein